MRDGAGVDILGLVNYMGGEIPALLPPPLHDEQ